MHREGVGTEDRRGSSIRVPVALSVTALFFFACAGSPMRGPLPAASPATEPVATATHCVFGEGWWSSPLRVNGVPIVTHGTAKDARLDGRVLEAHLMADGWHILGEADLAQERVLRLQSTMWITPGVFVTSGELVDVEGVGPDRVRLSLARFLPDDLQIDVAPERVVPCAAVALDAPSHGTDFPDDLVVTGAPNLQSFGRDDLTLAHTPRGSPFLRTTGESEETLTALVLEERNEDARISVYLSEVTAHFVGWIPRAVLQPTHPPSGGAGGLRGYAATTFDHLICRAEERLPLSAHVGGDTLSVGYIEANAEMRVMSPLTEVPVRVRPLRAGLLRWADGVTLSVRPSTAMQCERAEGNSERKEYRLSVAQSRGLSCTDADCQCQVTLIHRRGAPICQATLQCSERVLFGGGSFGGTFPCTVDGQGRFRGEDVEPSNADGGDPQFAIDTETGIVTASDNAHGPQGAFALEGRLVPE